MNWPLIISIAVNLVILAALLAGRKWIEASVEKTVQHRLDQKLEATKSDLRAKEAEISSLRDMVLSGTAQRNAMLDKRKLEAVERIWASLARLAPFVMVSRMMRSINFEVAEQRAPREPKLQQFFEMIAKRDMVDGLDKEHPAIHEQPFITPLAWAYFSAYQSIVMSAYATARVLAEGLADAAKLLRRDNAKGLLKTILPHHSAWIETADPLSLHDLLEEIKDLLLSELQRNLEGHEADKGAVEQARRISEQLRAMEKNQGPPPPELPKA